MSQKPFGLLVMAYGTPRSLDDVEAYYTHIRRGRAPTKELLDDLIRRYEAIGGVSPLTRITEAQANGIADVLNQDGGRPCRVYLGMKHADPSIDAAVLQMANDGIEDAVTLVLAPHYSSMSVAAYQKTAQGAAEKFGSPRLTHVDSWHLQPRFLSVLADRVRTALQSFPHPEETMVIFTAHSLPERILTVNDPYPEQLRETGTAIARKLGINRFMFGWQSAGRTGEPWLGPDVMDVLNALADQGQRDVIICPIGFVSDHLEVLYDIDIDCQNLAHERGMRLVRTESLNVHPEFLRALAEVVRAAQSGVGSTHE